ncbi:MAG: S8 family serine peptidase [Microthrixaceae bacterium]
MADPRRSILAGAAAGATLLIAACVPPPPTAPVRSTTTTTAAPSEVPMLCSEKGEAPADALAASAASLPRLRRAAASVGASRPEPLVPDDRPAALDADQITAAAEAIAAEPQVVPGSASRMVAVAVSALVEGRPVVRTVVESDPGEAVAEVIGVATVVAAAGGEVVAVEPDVIVDTAPAADPYPVDDEYRDEQWSFDMFDFEDTWCASTGAGVKVAVVDSGVDAAHPDLVGKVVSQVDMSLDPPLGNGKAGEPGRHGTHVAGTIAALADNSIGTAGVAPGVDILDVKALTTEGLGTQGFTARDRARGRFRSGCDQPRSASRVTTPPTGASTRPIPPSSSAAATARPPLRWLPTTPRSTTWSWSSPQATTAQPPSSTPTTRRCRTPATTSGTCPERPSGP